MSKKCLFQTITVSVIVIGLAVVVSIFGFCTAVRTLTDSAAESTARQVQDAAVHLRYVRDHFDRVLTNLSPDKEVVLIVKNSVNEPILVTVPADTDEAKRILKELVKDERIQDITVRDKEPENMTDGAVSCPLVYHIQKGDTLSSISDKVFCSVDELAAYNKIKNVNLIYAGSSLRIPERKD